MTPVQQAQAVHSGDGYTFIEGQAGSDVSGVTLEFPGGSSVQATVQNGWFAAWWPGTTDATSAVLTTPAGTPTVTLPAPKAPGCATPPSGSTTGCSSSSGPAVP